MHQKAWQAGQAVWHPAPAALLGNHSGAKETSHHFLMAGHVYQGRSETQIAVFPVCKHTWENPLQLPPTLRIFLFGLGSRTKAGPRGARPGGRVLSARRGQTEATGRYRPSSLAVTAVYTQTKGGTTKDKTQNVKRAPVPTSSETAPFSPLPCAEKPCAVTPGLKRHRRGMLRFSLPGHGNGSNSAGLS